MRTLLITPLALFGVAVVPVRAAQQDASPRRLIALTDGPWRFIASDAERPDAPELAEGWKPVSLPHVYWSRVKPREEIVVGWYRRDIEIGPDLAGRRLYLAFEGAGTIADVHVNGQHLGQHRGAYTRFIFDAASALRPGKNTLSVRVDNSPASMKDCLPDGSRLYKVYGGIYRKVWLLAADPVHVDPTDHASPGVFITPRNVTEASADLSVKVLLRNTTAHGQAVDVRARLADPSGRDVLTLTGRCTLPADGRDSVTLSGRVERPRLWSPSTPDVYRVLVEVLRGGALVDLVTEPTGFRGIEFKDGLVKLNGRRIVLTGGNLHQEIEAKSAAMSDDDFRQNFAMMKDLGFNWVRLAHYPHARVEYDLCDRLGLLCWAENGHTNKDQACDNTRRINAEMVKQNYNHPSIVVWSVGNEAGSEPAEEFVPLVKSLDDTRPVAVANMRCRNADFTAANTYAGWYGAANMWDFKGAGYVSETGAGGVVTAHCDYAAARRTVNRYEPEEYQQLFAESRLQIALRNNDSIGMFTWWIMRDFNNRKYKGGWNTKGLLTYSGDKKDIYYLFRCFVNPTVPTVHIASKRYFLRTGAADNGIKAYSNAAQLILTLNGRKQPPLKNGRYRHANGRGVDNVFHWPVKLRTGRNSVVVDDGAGHSDCAIVYFHGEGGEGEAPGGAPLVTALKAGNPANRAYYMDMPVQSEWPIYWDLDCTADNSLAALPKAVEGATWIAMRRPTKAGQESGVSFKISRPATVYVMCTKLAEAPTFLVNAGFREVHAPGLQWRDNDLYLVPAQLYSLAAKADQTIQLAAPGRDMLVMLKDQRLPMAALLSRDLSGAAERP